MENGDNPQDYRQLIQRYLLGLIQNGDLSNDDSEDGEYTVEFVDDDDNEEEEEEEEGTETQQPEVNSFQSEQRNKLKEHHYAQVHAVNTGCNANGKQPNILDMLNKREYSQRFNTHQLAHAGQRYVPRSSKKWEQYHHQIFCGQFSKDGNLFMSACQDRRIRLYDFNTRKKEREILARDIGWSIIDTDYSPDQRWLIYSSWSDYIHICNIVGEHETHEALDMKPEAHRFCLFSIKFSPDSSEILGGSSDRCIYIYNLDRREVSLRIEAHSDDINTVCYAEQDNNNTFITGSDDNLCKVWDRRLLGNNKKEPVGVMVGHMKGITHVSSKGDGRYFISNSKDQKIKLWDMRRMKEPKEAASQAASVADDGWDYRYHPLGRGNRSSSRSSHPHDNSLMTYQGHQVFQTLIRSYFSPVSTTGQKYIYTGSYDGSVYIYDALTGKLVSKLSGHGATIRDLSWHPYEPVIASTSWDSSVRLWDMSPKKGKEEDDE